MMSGKIKQGLPSGSNGNCKHLLDFPEAKAECFNKFVISPANQSNKKSEMGK